MIFPRRLNAKIGGCLYLTKHRNLIIQQLPVILHRHSKQYMMDTFYRGNVRTRTLISISPRSSASYPPSFCKAMWVASLMWIFWAVREKCTWYKGQCFVSISSNCLTLIFAWMLRLLFQNNLSVVIFLSYNLKIVNGCNNSIVQTHSIGFHSTGCVYSITK